MPFDRFAGSDSLLGPEMRSTGEVMGVAHDFPAAFAKAQAAAGARLPRTRHRVPHRHRLRQGRRGRHRGAAARPRLRDRRDPRDGGGDLPHGHPGAARSTRSREGSPHVVDWIERGDVDLVINTPTGTAARTDGYEIRGAATARGIPCITTLSGGMAAARAIAAARHGEPAVCRCRSCTRAARRSGRERARSRRSAGGSARSSPHARVGAYDVISVLDAEGPRAGPGPVLHARRGRALGRGRRRAAVPPARVLGAAAPRRRAARLPVRGRRPGHAAAVRAARRRRPVAARAAGRRLPRAGGRAAAAAGRRRGRDRAAGDLAGRARRADALLGFRDAAHAEGAELLRRAAGRHRRRLGRPSTGSSPNCSREEIDAALRGLRLRAAADARGGAGAVRASRTCRRSSRSSRGWRAGTARASAASCRRARATCGCASTGRARRRRSGGCRGVTTFCGIPLAHPIINASGTFDAIAARRAFGDALLARFPFAAFVSKTVTVEPRQGNPPPRLWELPAGMINSIGLPNKGLEGYLAHDLPELAAAAGAADRQRHGLHRASRSPRSCRPSASATRSPGSSSTSPARTSRRG